MYDRQIDENTELTFGVSGMLYQNGLIMYDRETQSLWSHILGQAIAGDLQGTSLTFIPARQLDWETWQERHPDTLVVDPARFGNDVYTSYYQSPDAGVIDANLPRDEALYSKEYVVGIRLNGAAKAYPFSELNLEPVVNDSVGEVPLVIFFDKGTASGYVFSRQTPDGQTLTFSAGDDAQIAIDNQTGSTWDTFSGEALDGTLAGTQLQQIPGTYAFWFGWSDYHPETALYERE